MKETFNKIKQFKEKHYSYELDIPKIRSLDLTKPKQVFPILNEDERPYERRRGW